MTQFLYANNAATTLAGPIASNATTINLAAGTGALFPNPGVGQQFAVTLISAANKNVLEIAYCTGRAVDTLTVVRAQEGTTATSFIAGDLVDNDLTAGTCAAFIQISQLQQEAPNYGVDTGSVNALQVTLTPQPGSLALISGSPIRVLVRNTNTSTTTLTITGLPTTTVVTQEGLALPAGTIVGGQIFEFFYNPGIGFEVSSPLMLLGRAANAWTGNQTVGGTLTVDNALGVQGALTVLGNTILASLGVNGAATIGGNLGVTGAFTVFGQSSFSDPITAAPAVASNQCITLGQLFATVNTVTGSRALNTAFSNTTGKPMFVAVATTSNGPNGNLTMVVNGTIQYSFGQPGSGAVTSVTGMVAVGATYGVFTTVTTFNLQDWVETY